MANKLYSKFGSGGGGSNKAQGSPPSTAMPVKTAGWPGLPGKDGPNRSGGTPNHGYAGQFYAMQQFSPKKMGKPMEGEMTEMHKKMAKKSMM